MNHLTPLEEMSARSNAPTSQFLNGTNYQKIVGFLRQEYARKTGSPAISKRMDERLQKTVQHYMTEVARLQPGKAPAVLNQEVLRETTASMDTWLRRQESAAPPTTTTVGAFARPDEYNRLFEDTGTRYENMMADRMPPTAAVPAVPDFRQTNDILESDEDPVLLMQRMQKQRESQSRMLGLAGPPPVATPPRLEIKEEVVPSATNPIAPQADAPPALLAPRPQDYIIPQESIVKYRETELNLFITSADRDWLRNTSENRYNFTVNFNTGSKKTGYGFNTAIQTRLRNIQRIEFVKAIVPIESLTQIVRVVGTKSQGPPLVTSYDTGRVVNVFSLPFVGVRIDELEPNGYSTKPEEDATFAIVQYDTTWSSDLYAPNTINPTTAINNVCAKSGYTGLIPKFLKAQRVYTPTPLATLQKLSISMQQHTGNLLSNDSDVWSVANICLNDCVSPAIGNPSSGCSSYENVDISNAYIYVRTANYFPFSAISEGDNIQFQAYAPLTQSAAATDFANFINRAAGHYVVATAHIDACGEILDGRNNAGYCNVIVIRSRFDDPSTGSVGRDTVRFGGSQAAEDTFTNLLCSEAAQAGAALINLSRQTHLVLRVVTRDMDSGANIRPDNV
jgi:hypothetical protein